MNDPSARFVSQRSQIPQREEDQDEIDLLGLLRTLWRGKFWIVLSMCLAIVLGGYYAFVRATPLYTASSKVALESQQSSVVDIQDVVSGLSTDQGTINTELEVLRSRNLIGNLVDRLGLTEDAEFNPRLEPENPYSLGAILGAVRGLIGGSDNSAELAYDARNVAIDRALDRISVSNLRDSYVFQITATTESRDKSAAIANTLADLYIEDQLEVKFEKTRQATEWLSERVASLQSQVERSAEQVKDFRAQADIISPEALETLNLQLKDRRDRLQEARTAQEQFQERLDTLLAARDAGDRDRMTTLADDPTLTRLHAMIEDGDSSAVESFQARYAQIVERVRQNLMREENQESVLARSIAEQEAQIEEQSQELVTLQQLEREAEANRVLYEYFLTRLKETSVQEGIQQADARVLSPAVKPIAPSEPRKSMILALSAMLGLLAGAGAVLGKEMLQNTFRTGEELERVTGYTVMGQVPQIPAKKRSAVIEYLSKKPTSAAAEAVRNLRTSLLLSNVDKPPRLIMMTSTVPGEGKTTLSIALAQNLSGLGKRVLLIEGDIRRRTFTQYFDDTSDHGLLSVISGEVSLDKAVFRHKSLDFDILMGEKSSINAADVFSSEHFKDFLKKAREQYDIILIDTPPVLVVPDARVLGQHADAILYSVLWDKTAKSQVSEGLRQLENVGLRPAGLVLSRIDPRGMRKYGYGQQYGSYYNASGYYDN